MFMKPFLKQPMVGLLLLLVFPAAFASSAAKDWQLVLEKPEGKMWQGQSAEFLILALNPPAGKMELEIADTADFAVATRSAVRLERNNKPALAFPVRLTPLKAGKLTLPVFTLGSHQTGSNENVTVSTPVETDDMSIHVSYDTDSVYLGQTLSVNFEWITSIHPNALQAVNILLPVFEHADILPVEPWDAFVSSDQNAIGLPVGSRRIIARWHRMGGDLFRIHFHYKVQPRKAGVFELPPSLLLASADPVLMRNSPQDFRGSRLPAHFDNNFFQAERSVTREPPVRLMTRAQPLRFEVKPLPSEVPENFSGMIGRPDIVVAAEPDEVHQGEPMQLRFEITHPDPEVARLPELHTMTAFTNSFDVPADIGPGTYENGVKIVRQSLFPGNADTTEIPSVIFSYFDPQTGHFHNYTTPPIPLTVIPVERFNISTSALSDDMELRNPVKPDQNGIWSHNWSQELVSQTQEKNPFRALFLLALLVSPPGLVLFGALSTIQEKWKACRGDSAITQLCDELKTGSDPLAPLSAYFYRRIALPPSKLNSQTLAVALSQSGISDALNQEVCQWLDCCQQDYASRTNDTQLASARHAAFVGLMQCLDKALPGDRVPAVKGVRS
ncbi:hypothetical protein GZ77_12065 [Endozoicomonas montiporae]|uniref:Protein BatD n=3 Tax=Endozoicomonas montiporae TaxID=1027273 RepID=A0A081N945_9GAMM|nr:BatD family protein [Endozoicomonas montiporae]AMO55092.1 hypothetical protein EZMO1_0874 [Endozoicomonas montiporae CL-33]KEQ14968.1 hypothetical protein GZ77_12065 [Endozoicomonas montiporae]